MEKNYRVQFDFKAEGQQELSCRAGEIVSSSAAPVNGWLLSKVSRRGASGMNETLQGLVPFGFLTEIPSSKPADASFRAAPKPPSAPPATAVNVAVEHAECAICYDEMASRPIGVLVASNGARCCRHFLHLDCANSLVSSRLLNCPICRTPFVKTSPLPDFDASPKEWFACVDADESKSLSKQEVVDVLKSTMAIDYRALEKNVGFLWGQWDKDGSGEIDFDELCDPKTGLLVYVRSHFARVKGKPSPPLNQRNIEVWFAFWDEDGSGTLEKEEILRAVVKTFGLSSSLQKIAEIREMINNIWDVFDADHSGVIELEEFIARDGLGESLCASLPQ